jgi:AcrR family transcriptional regulator
VTPLPDPLDDGVDWHRRVVGRSLRTAQRRSIDKGAALVRAAALLLERSDGAGFTVQDVADEAGQSLRTLYQYFESKDDLLLAVFEEAMVAYARLVRAAIADLDAPLDRLAGALLAAVRLPERSGAGVNSVLSSLRLRLTEVQPELVRRAQGPMTALLGELLDDAAAAGDIVAVDRDDTAFMLLALNTAAINGTTLGNDVGPRPPEPIVLVAFGLRGVGAVVTRKQLDAIGARLRFPKGKLRLSRT